MLSREHRIHMRERFESTKKGAYNNNCQCMFHFVYFFLASFLLCSHIGAHRRISECVSERVFVRQPYEWLRLCGFTQCTVSVELLGSLGRAYFEVVGISENTNERFNAQQQPKKATHNYSIYKAHGRICTVFNDIFGVKYGVNLGIQTISNVRVLLKSVITIR